ncbi:MAG: alpha-ketoglutarate-dependent dioxygenase AlkB [Kofleriaceae bacterium]|nr:alpha-ketoglutarate-dependent dioxygenase AlkB [Kofleriaceae bacterium]MBP9168323.1 alpha-ketoglutarate-dependent dioxygenase AlkB [Kofleriaceae bacterium]MBP9857202.1 alpha-ketoglutarate-dependent dioxygenase AlkB [Kofleriaceae bacterium]
MSRPPPPRRPAWRPVHDAERSYLYVPGYLTATARADLLAWLATLHPLWEQRYSTVRPLPPGREQRPLLRPVYWLGNWQFACLGYYEPPGGVRDRCVAAEPFPPCVAAIAADAEARVRARFAPADVPRGWHLNTALINFYGDRAEGERWHDVARVGEHRDFEPGPVVSLSLGERALFQFVPRGRDAARGPVRSQWLDDGALQAFGGRRWKDELLHRVQRVDRKLGCDLPPQVDGFRTRRVNLTFRYVPDEHVVPFARLGPIAAADVRGYVATLAAHVPFFAGALSTIPRGLSNH